MLSIRRRSVACTTAFVLGAFSGLYNRPPMLCTNKGYRRSVIFSLFANSSARSKGILYRNQQCDLEAWSKLATYQTPLRCIGPILTTCRVFSDFSMPSRRPRVMPATFRSFVPLMKWLSRAHVNICPGQRLSSMEPTFTTSHADSLRFDLKAKTSFILPQCRCHPRLHSRWSNLASRVEWNWRGRGVSLSRSRQTRGLWHVSLLRARPWHHGCGIVSK